MQFSTSTSSPDRLRTPCAILPVLAGKKLTAAGSALDAAGGGALARLLASGDLQAKAGATLLAHLDGAIKRVLLVSLGDAEVPADKAYCDAVRGAWRAAATLAADEVASLLHEAPVAQRDTAWKLRMQVGIGRELAYRFERMKSKREPQPVRPARVVLPVARAEATAAGTAVAQAAALANGIELTKDLGNLPGNVCTPTYLADTARKLGREFKFKVDVLDVRKMEALKMGALLSVARGSEQPPKLIVLHYQGAGPRQAPVALVGKGITFDTGGISLKPAAEMDEMKYDMCGAASVLGTLRAVAEMGLKINVVGVIAASENMPSGRATKPGDIVTSMSGQTVEILNTDAEGRLVLCDALTYVQRYKPSAIVDIATLTGACVIALGHHHSGLFTPQQALADELLAAGSDAGDPCWRMPLDDEYQEQLKSPFADMANIGGRPAGSITAACFLSRFTKGANWAHLDIAGTAWKSGANKGASGRPVPLLTRFLQARAKG
ncbi:MAG: leucyl aminopeptidase [Burkholderiales bacterium]|nr:leucyl aminopeptidase [Burkholderiales bacterium]